MSSYKKGKDIKVPFDCLWYYYTRKFQSIITTIGTDLFHSDISRDWDKPEDFDNW